jgi:ApaG protein
MDIPLPTASIHIDIETQYLPEQSLPIAHRYTFAYRITIRNTGSQPLTLRRRYWLITNDNQVSEEVEGEGVVGQQPCLQPGEHYIYISGAQLTTPYGQMQGYYTFEDAQGQKCYVGIPAFLLSIPRIIH